MATASFDAQFLNIPIRTLYISGSALSVVVREATIKRSHGRHDSADLSVLIDGELTFDGNARITLQSGDTNAGAQSAAVESLVGQPVSFVYGVSPQVETFYGYVTEVVPAQQFKQGLNYTIRMTGSTFSCQRIYQAFYVNLTDTEIAKQAADRSSHGFYTNANLTYRWPSVGVTQYTDWELLNALSSRNGCLLFNWGGVIRMEESRALFKQYPFTTLVSSDDLLESSRKLMDFTPVAKGVNQVNTRPMEFFFFDRNGQVVSHKSDPNRPVSTPYSSEPIFSREEAELSAQSLSNTVSRWLHTATARVRGDASIYPGVTVDVNTGTRSSTAKFNGRWLVLQVSHSMQRDAFATELTLARPGDLIPALTKSNFDHFWRSTERPRPTVTLRNSRWVSSWASPNTEAVA